VVNANVQAVATIRLAHRRDIQRARKITNALLDELEQMADADTVAYLQELGEMLRSPDDNGMDKLNDLYQKVISLPERSKTMKVLPACAIPWATRWCIRSSLPRRWTSPASMGAGPGVAPRC